MEFEEGYSFGVSGRVEPFEIRVSDEAINDLAARLRRTRWSPEVGNEDWRYGTSGKFLREFVDRWTAFDWRAQEKLINELPHFRVEVDDTPIHFMYKRGNGPAPMPLILSHGWPWSFWDWSSVIGPLSDPGAYGGDPADAFDVVVPSLPGFAFSTPLTERPVTVPWVAAVWNELMTGVLGYERYGAAGGDWGEAITTQLTRVAPDRVAGIYLSTAPTTLLGGMQTLRADEYAEDEAGWYEHTQQMIRTVLSHGHVHVHDPQTLAWALNDSPVGLAAWLLERRRNWSDCGGDVSSAYSMDFLLTTVSLYWFSNCFGSSARIYADGAASLSELSAYVDTPMGVGVYPHDIFLVPRSRVESAANLVHWSVLPRGGHFAPSEQPQLVVDELRSFFRPLR